jgi:hypothetical protein
MRDALRRDGSMEGPGITPASARSVEYASISKKMMFMSCQELEKPLPRSLWWQKRLPSDTLRQLATANRNPFE